MLKSIERSATIAEVSLDDIDLKDKRPWGGKNIFERARDVGLDAMYLAAFSGVSHNIHGNWHDLYGHHLSFDERTARFSPDLTWSRPRPQLLSSMALVVARVVDEYFRFIASQEVARHVRECLEDFESRVQIFVEGHEGFLGGKTWPEI